MTEDQRSVHPHILRKDLGGGDGGGDKAVCTVKDPGGEVLCLFPGKEAAEEFMKEAPGCASMEPYAPSSLEEISRICAEHNIVWVALYEFFGTDIDVLKVEYLPKVFTKYSE